MSANSTVSSVQAGSSASARLGLCVSEMESKRGSDVLALHPSKLGIDVVAPLGNRVGLSAPLVTWCWAGLCHIGNR